MNKKYDTNILLKDTFTPVREKLFEMLFRGFNKSYRVIDYYWDEDLYFAYIFKKITNFNLIIKQEKDLFFKTGILKYFTVGFYIGKNFFSGHSESLYNIDDVYSSSKAKGEFLERLSSRFDIDKLLIYLKKESKTDDINSLKSFINRENRKKIFCRSLLNLSYKRFDIDRIYYGYGSYNSKKYFNYQPTTNACAGHFDLDEAIVNAWLEAIQRDAFMVYWLNSIKPIKIDLSSLFNNQDDKLVKTIDILQRHLDVKVDFFDIMSDIKVPTILCAVTLNSGNNKIVTFGGSSGFDMQNLFLRSLEESLSVAVYNVDTDKKVILEDCYKAFSRFDIDKISRINMYKTDENIKKLDYLFKTDNIIDIDRYKSNFKQDFSQIYTTKQRLTYLKDLFKMRAKVDSNFNVYIYEFKNKLLKAFDYNVIRIIIPGLYSIYLNESFANPHHPRLKEFLVNKNLQDQAKLNIWPHPFP